MNAGEFGSMRPGQGEARSRGRGFGVIMAAKNPVAQGKGKARWADRGAQGRVSPGLQRALAQLSDLLAQLQKALNAFAETRLPGGGAALASRPTTAAGQPLRRMFPSDYAGSGSEPSGGDRASAREISNAVSASGGMKDNRAGASDLFWLWGQFLDHDIDLSHADGAAFDIEIPAGDPRFDPEGTGTARLPMKRSESIDNPFGAAQQVNAITALIDGSNVYGSDAETTRSLRSFEGGRLRMSEDGLLPQDARGFFVAGDERANENIALTSMHTLFAREHNRIADALAQEHPGWTDDQLFAEARKWVTAQMQEITVNEFLPVLLGTGAMGPYRGPVAGLDGQIANAFSAAAYRFGHSMVSDTLTLDRGTGETEALPLRDAFFSPQTFAEVGPDAILRGLAGNTAQAVDTEIVDSLRNFVMDGPGSVRLDLAALNVQRGRDHGLPTLNDARASLGMRRIVSFDDPALRDGVGARLAEVYDSPNDVDLWVGLLAERPQGDGLVGPTQHAILSDQFARLRAADPNWYETVLTPAQIAAVNRSSLADVIARNTDVGDLRPDAMIAPQEQPVV